LHCIYISRLRRSGFVDFTKLLFTLSSLAQLFDQMRSIQEHFFLSTKPAPSLCRMFSRRNSQKRTGPKTKWPLQRLHPPSYKSFALPFAVYLMNESCAQRFSRRLMLLRILNRSCLQVAASNVTEVE